jgi:hypothetical protein
MWLKLQKIPQGNIMRKEGTGQRIGMIQPGITTMRRGGVTGEHEITTTMDPVIIITEAEEVEVIMTQQKRKPKISTTTVLRTARYVRDRAGDYYDDARGYIPGRRQVSPRDYYGRRARDTDREDYYKSRTKIDDLGEVVESMGWRRVGKVPKDHGVSVSSPKEVVIGDVKYVWPQGKGQPPTDELHNTVFNSVKGAAHTVGEKLGFVKERAKDSGARAKDQAYDTLRDGRSWSSRPFDRDYEEEEDSILTRGARNVKEGVRNAGQVKE